MSLAPGTRLGPYELLSEAGRGGMGEVYRARDTRLGREVAVKLLSPEFAADRAAVARFEQEARAASALNHPNLITIHDVGQIDGRPYIAMEWLDGPSLRQRLAEGPVRLEEAVPLAVHVADGLAAAHERGIVHRDLKPENIMLPGKGRPKILDFGIAKQTTVVSGQAPGTVATFEPLTQAGILIGTAGYMSPEQAGGHPVDFRSDQFSFGAILYEVLTGRRAFQRSTAVGTLAAVVSDEPEIPLAQGPPLLRRIVARCLEKDPADRYGSTRDLAADLASVAEDLRGARDRSGLPPGARVSRRASAFALATVLLLVSLSIWGYWRQSRSSSDRAGAPASELGRSAELAVLPLRVLTASTVNPDLGLGMADAIITRLANVRQLKLRPTSAIVAYQNNVLDAQQIGEDLGVAHVLVGTLQRADEAYRVALQLIRTADGVAIWGRTYDIRRRDLLGLEDAVSEQVARALQLQLTAAEHARLARQSTSNVAAYEQYLLGRGLFVNYTEAKMRAAIDSFDRALTLEPNYPLARAGLAMALAWFSVRFAYESDAQQWGKRAEEEARRALARDPGLADAHLAIASAAGTTYGRFDWRELLAESDEALKLDPSMDLAYTARARAFYHLGLFDQADAAARAAIDLNPASNIETDRLMAASSLFAGRFEDARVRSERLLAKTDAPVVRMYLGEALFYLGQRARAADMLGNIKRGQAPDVRSQAALAGVLAANGQRASAERVIQTILAGPYRDHHVAYSLAAALAQLNRPGDAVTWLRAAADDGFPCYPWFLSDPLLDPIRPNPAYLAFIVDLRRRHDEARQRYGGSEGFASGDRSPRR